MIVAIPAPNRGRVVVADAPVFIVKAPATIPFPIVITAADEYTVGILSALVWAVLLIVWLIKPEFTIAKNLIIAS